MVSVDETGTQVTASVMFAVMVPLLLLTVQFCPAGCVTGVTPYDAPLAYFVANVRVVLSRERQRIAVVVLQLQRPRGKSRDRGADGVGGAGRGGAGDGDGDVGIRDRSASIAAWSAGLARRRRNQEHGIRGSADVGVGESLRAAGRGAERQLLLGIVLQYEIPTREPYHGCAEGIGGIGRVGAGDGDCDVRGRGAGVVAWSAGLSRRLRKDRDAVRAAERHESGERECSIRIDRQIIAAIILQNDICTRIKTGDIRADRVVGRGWVDYARPSASASSKRQQCPNGQNEQE